MVLHRIFRVPVSMCINMLRHGMLGIALHRSLIPRKCKTATPTKMNPKILITIIGVVFVESVHSTQIDIAELKVKPSMQLPHSGPPDPRKQSSESDSQFSSENNFDEELYASTAQQFVPLVCAAAPVHASL